MSAQYIHAVKARKRTFGFLYIIAITTMAISTEAVKPGTTTTPNSDASGTLDLSGGYVTNMGYIDAAVLDKEFTNAALRTLAVSIGQLGGVNPETGEIITDEANLLPLVSKEMDVTGKAYFYTNIYISGDTFVYGAIYGSGVGITNLPVQNISGLLTARPEVQSALSTKLDAEGVWETINESTATISDLQTVIDALNSSIEDTNNPHHVTAAQAGALAVTGGKVSGHIDMDGVARIVNLPEPASDQDAVSKAYLDQRLNFIPPQGDIGMGIYTNAP